MQAPDLLPAILPPAGIFNAISITQNDAPAGRAIIGQLAALVAATGDDAAIAKAALAIASPTVGDLEPNYFSNIARLLDALDHRKITIDSLSSSLSPEAASAAAQLKQATQRA